MGQPWQTLRQLLEERHRGDAAPLFFFELLLPVALPDVNPGRSG